MKKSKSGMHEKELIITRAEIDQRIKELGSAITRDYLGKDLVVVGILKGAFVFMADLIRTIDLDLAVDFLQVASYGQAHVASGPIRIGKDIELDITAKHVLRVEDIVDTGCTLVRIKEFLAGRRPLSIRSCVLIDKKERRQEDIRVDYVGFVVDKGFLVGYGLDYGERYRQLPDVSSLIGL